MAYGTPASAVPTNYLVADAATEHRQNAAIYRRKSQVNPDKLAYAVHLRETGHSIAQIVTKTGIARTSLYRRMPARELPPVTAAAAKTDPT